MTSKSRGRPRRRAAKTQRKVRGFAAHALRLLILWQAGKTESRRMP
jgi:hypothetical protein